MARYASWFTVEVPPTHLQQLLVEVLQACNLDIVYHTSDYVMAQEIPGKTTFAQLVVVEVLTDKTMNSTTETRINVVVKNEELPLQMNNHCYQMFQLVNQAIADNRQWQLRESICG